MKDNRNQELAHAWIDRAKDDVLWAKDSFKMKHFSGVCFLGQQAVEKALKAYLFLQDEKLIRTHDLLRLLEKCVTYDEVFVELKNACIILSDYYIDTRYPDIWDRDRFNDEKMAEEALKLTINTVAHIDATIQKYQKK